MTFSFLAKLFFIPFPKVSSKVPDYRYNHQGGCPNDYYRCNTFGKANHAETLPLFS